MDRIEEYRIRLRWIIIRAQSRPVFKQFLRLWCRVGVWWGCRLLIKMPGVVAIYSRHTLPGSPSFVPGHSDLDTAIVLSEEAARDPQRIDQISARIEELYWWHYYLSPEDVRFTSAKELARFTRTYSARYETLYTPDDWVLMAGREVREAEVRPFPIERMPWHPEFNMWWQHILQHYLMVSQEGEEDQYLRVFYRSVLRQQLLFLAASGKEATKELGHVDDAQVKIALHYYPKLLNQMLDLKQNAFWAHDPEAQKAHLLWGALRLAADFYSQFALAPDFGHPSLKSDPAAEHQKAYAALKARLAELSQICEMLKGALVYPVPHWQPYFYQLDLVIPDDIPHTEFRKLLKLAQDAFSAREFFLEDQGFSITYVPESVMKQPLYFLGTPYPFLKEHIQRYGAYLLGDRPESLEGGLNHQDMVKWCRTYMPFYLTTLERRVEYSSRTVNFCQMASIRLFLTTGTRETDPGKIRKRHAEVFKSGGPTDEVWDYLQRDKPGRKPFETYRSATLSLINECREVEALLAQKT